MRTIEALLETGSRFSLSLRAASAPSALVSALVTGLLVVNVAFAGPTSSLPTTAQPTVVVTVPGGLSGALFGQILEATFEVFSPPTESYVVRGGDTVCSILRERTYPPPCMPIVRALYRLNPGLEQHADKLSPGDKLRLPLFKITANRVSSEASKNIRQIKAAEDAQVESEQAALSAYDYFRAFTSYKIFIRTSTEEQAIALKTNLSAIQELEVKLLNADEQISDAAKSKSDTIQSTESSPADQKSPSATVLAEGNVTNRIVVQLRGRNAADDWVTLVKQLQSEGDSLKYIDVPPQQNGGLCQTYVSELGLPGCTESVLRLAQSLNPQAKDILSGDIKIKVPILPLHSSEWTLVLDRDIPEDAAKLTDLETRWVQGLIKREDTGTRTRLYMKAYDVFLPIAAAETSAKSTQPSFDKVDSTIQKKVISGPDRTRVKSMFSAKLLEHLNDCNSPTYSAHEPTPYSLLLGETDLPACAKVCAGGPDSCPRINLFDTKVFLHPDIKEAVESGGDAGGDHPPMGSVPMCPTVTFNKAAHHGTMLAAIMVSQPDSQFVGLAPKARLRVWWQGNRPSQKSWAEQLRQLAIDDKPQIFVFAGQFEYPKDLVERGGTTLKREEDRLGYPDVVREILDNRVTWITAAGQPENPNELGHQLTPIRAESPMNLGDQRNIIVVTSCETCLGDDAKLWQNAYFSLIEDGLVNLAAPGGNDKKPIPGAATKFQYSTAFGTSQATAYVAGVAAAMLSCFPRKYDARRIKARLQITADPLPRKEDAEKVTGGIVNIKRALLDPSFSWLNRGIGFERMTDVHWCRETFQLKDADTGDDLTRVRTHVTDSGDQNKDFSMASIVRFHDSAGGKSQWQIASVNPYKAKIQWSGPGSWADDKPILAGKIGESQTEEVVTGQQIYSFVSDDRFQEIKVAPCQP